MESISNKKLISMLNVVTENHNNTKEEINALLLKLESIAPQDVSLDLFTETQKEESQKIVIELQVLDSLKSELEIEFANIAEELKKRKLF